MGLQLNVVGQLAGSVRADYNVNLVNTQSFALSIDPALQVLGSTDFGAERISGNLGVFVDFYKSEAAILSLNLKPGFEYFSESLMLGAGVLVQRRLAENWFLMPFVDFNWIPGTDNYRVELHAGVGVAYRTL